MRRVFFVLLCVLVAHTVSAQALPKCDPPISGSVPYNAVSLTWTLPTTTIDNKPLTPPVTVTLLEQGGSGMAKLCEIADASAASWSGLSAGTHAWVVTATTAEGQSVYSNIAAKTVVVPPIILVDPAHPDAYSTLKVSDGFVLARVGTVAIGTVCDKTQSVTSGGITYYVVPKSFVTPSNPNATALVARCL